MKTRYFAAAVAFVMLAFTSCINDLDTIPLNENDITSEVVYGTEEKAYIQGLAKLYATISSEELVNVSANDAGASQVTRAFWACQEITTDACKCAWGNDGWVRTMNYNTWSDAENDAVFGVFFRSLQAISYCNEYLRQTASGKLSDRGVGAELAAKIQSFRAEARVIRAWYYWMAMDVFGAVPFATEDTPFGARAPPPPPPHHPQHY
uniref:RagB/SusD family nutrient uptake outer membrane protein n=1 Tax=Alistipes sp. TaxID=1872444 RepID=UPI00405754BD